MKYTYEYKGYIISEEEDGWSVHNLNNYKLIAIFPTDKEAEEYINREF